MPCYCSALSPLAPTTPDRSASDRRSSLSAANDASAALRFAWKMSAIGARLFCRSGASTARARLFTRLRETAFAEAFFDTTHAHLMPSPHRATEREKCAPYTRLSGCSDLKSSLERRWECAIATPRVSRGPCGGGAGARGARWGKRYASKNRACGLACVSLAATCVSCAQLYLFSAQAQERLMLAANPHTIHTLYTHAACTSNTSLVWRRAYNGELRMNFRSV